MYFIKIDQAGNLTTPIATIFEGKKSKYYNIKLGTKEPKFGCVTIGLDSSYFSPEVNKLAEIQLNGSNYELKPIIVKGKVKTDNKGNNVYNITIGKKSKDFLIIWEIKNEFYTDIEYEITKGIGKILTKGYNGKDRGNIVYKSPELLIEACSDIIVSWKGKDINNNEIGEDLVFNINTRSIEIINKGAPNE